MWGGGEYELRIINYELRIMGGERTFCVLAEELWEQLGTRACEWEPRELLEIFMGRILKGFDLTFYCKF